MNKRRLFSLFVVTPAAIVSAYAAFEAYRFFAPGPLAEEKTLIVLPRAAGGAPIAPMLEEEGVIASAQAFRVAALLTRAHTRLKAGEYRFPAHVSAQEVLRMMQEGKTVARRFTMAEGLSVRQVGALLMAEPALFGALPENIEEGSLLPETYHFSYGDTRESIIRRMERGMQEVLEDAWKSRRPGLPLRSREEALTLASIVEKETGIPEERGRVAAVFINRLRAGMKLQSDPTTAYAIEREDGPLSRALTLKDLARDLPHNTYVIPALPPTPICNPGREAIKATLNPPQTQEYYFVATGDGGHRFARTLEEHNRNVALYRKAQRAAGAD